MKKLNRAYLIAPFVVLFTRAIIVINIGLSNNDIIGMITDLIPFFVCLSKFETCRKYTPVPTSKVFFNLPIFLSASILLALKIPIVVLRDIISSNISDSFIADLISVIGYIVYILFYITLTSPGKEFRQLKKETKAGKKIERKNNRKNKKAVKNQATIQQPVQQPIYKQPIQQPVQQPVQQPIYRQPIQQPVQQPVAPPVKQPAQQPVQQQATKPIQQPIVPPVQTEKKKTLNNLQ